MSTFFQNLTSLTDGEVYAHELGMADRAEALGFDSIWAAEHHFSGYTMCPNVAQFLTYMAGRTKKVQLGSMVMVLPWHHPLRVAEEFCVLDHMSGGRAILGIGRGLGRIEFEGFNINMGESRERFVEYSEALLKGLETGTMEYDGHYYKQPRVEIRPRAFKTFKGRTYASAVSPESSRIMAKLGIGVMVIAQKPWDKTASDLNNYREIYREINHGEEPPKPLLVSFVACHSDESVAKEMHSLYTRRYNQSAVEHYEFANTALEKVKGYEYYGAVARGIERYGIGKFTDLLSDLQVWGTPNQVYEKLLDNRAKIDAGGIITVFSYGGMPRELASQNMHTFAADVLPKLKAFAV